MKRDACIVYAARNNHHKRKYQKRINDGIDKQRVYADMRLQVLVDCLGTYRISKPYPRDIPQRDYNNAVQNKVPKFFSSGASFEVGEIAKAF